MPIISANSVETVINEYLKEYGDVVHRANEQAIRKVAKDVTKDLKKAGDFGGTGAFRKSIGVEIQETRIGIDAVIGAKKPYYRLTHLLEFGHAKQNGGRTKAFNFVAPINDTVFDRYRKELEDLLNDI